jgi:signal transduction histidine kinase
MLTDDLQRDIAAISRIDAVPTILNVVCRTTGMGFAAVARVTEERWIACSVKDEIAFGLEPGGELKIETTICNEIREHREPVIINHVDTDETYCNHDTPSLYGFQSYISVPIELADGTFFGTLCAIDPRPARLDTPEVIGMFKLFAELIAFHLNALDKIMISEADLARERETSALREQFIAVLGHDLRNPLTAIEGGVRMLEKEALSERGTHVLELLGQTTRRMAALIDNVLDFARGRLGGGIMLSRDQDGPLTPILEQVVAELRAGYPNRRIETEFKLTLPVMCDQTRISQLFSNLLGNALTHGAKDKPVFARASTIDDVFELSVSNAGEPIPADALERLFAPFSRGEGQRDQKGLGLGLYIASEIAQAHDGNLTVDSTAEETRFTFRMPIKQVH